MVTGFELWRYYLSIKLHFTSKDYDAVKSSGHVTGGQTAYAKRRDKMIFDVLAAKFDQPRDAIKYLVANFVYGHNNVIYDREVSQDLLKKWIKNKESLSRIFAEDLCKIVEYCADQHKSFDDALHSSVVVLKMYKSNLINIESVNLITQFNPQVLNEWESLPETHLLYENDLLRIRKLTSFLNTTDMCLKVWKEFNDDLGEWKNIHTTLSTQNEI